MISSLVKNCKVSYNIGMGKEQLSGKQGFNSKKPHIETMVGNISTYLMHAHTIEGMSHRQIADDISRMSKGAITINKSTVGNWIQKAKIPTTFISPVCKLTLEHSRKGAVASHRPEGEAKRRISLNKTWSDATRRQEMLAKIQSPEAQKQRREGIAKSWIERKRKIKTERTRKATLKRVQEGLNGEKRALVQHAADSGILYTLSARDQFILGARYLNESPLSYAQLASRTELSLNSKQAVAQCEERLIQRLLQARKEQQ